MTVLYRPQDTENAYLEWGANCGPAALAAITCREVAAVREALGPDWPGYTNPTHIKHALTSLGYDFQEIPEPLPETGAGGLAFLQWCGPWERHVRGAYRYTHWIAFRRWPGVDGGLAVYDVNMPRGWYSLPQWEKYLLPHLLPKRSTGYRVRQWIGVRRKAA